MNRKTIKDVELDMHTHTIASGHAYGTILEMIKEASEKEMKLIGIKDHAKGVSDATHDM